jgi:ElaB/YqjD/DUF883 family membrane-anchored ribosome-binding protein
MTVRKTIQDSTYVAVGIAVLGSQRIQDHSRRLATSMKTSVLSFGDDAKARIEPVINRVAEPVQSAVEPAKAMINQVPAAAVELGSQVAKLPNVVTSAADRFGDTPERVRDLISRAMAEGKARMGGAVETAKKAAPYTSTKNATSVSANGTSGKNTASTNN